MQTSPPAKHLCQVTLLGNLVAKPEIRYSTNPVLATADITIATHSKWLDKQSKTPREWTDFHLVKAIGDACEQSLIAAEKGDLLLIKGTLIDQPKTDKQTVLATFMQTYPKGYAPSINQVYVSGRLASDIKLISTQQNKVMAEATIESHHSVYSPSKDAIVQHSINRTIHIWGKSAQHLAENGITGQELIVDGKLSYLNNKSKHQLIDAHQVIKIA